MVDKLRMSFDPNTIEHLGIKMYSNLPAALAELVANSYDAKASRVNIKIYTSDENDKSIVIEDNGKGMSFDEINKCFLRIGRNRRAEELTRKPSERKPTGKKGLGKLALFGIGERIEVLTMQGNEKTRFILDWNALKSTRDGEDYEPDSEREERNGGPEGTTITLKKLKRKSNFNIQDLSISLSKLFNFLSRNFRVFIYLNDSGETEVTNNLKFADLDEQFSWTFPHTASVFGETYSKRNLINGKILTTKTPLKAGRTGITLFANGRLVNLPEFFGHSESSNFFTYAIGWLNVDFVDEIEPDVISTDRQSLNWEDESMIELKAYLKNIIGKVHTDWRRKRTKKNEEESTDTTGINRDEWLSTVPEDKARLVSDAISRLSDPDSPSNPVSVTTSLIHEIMPAYAALHWRYLHPEIKNIAEDDYKNQRYFDAAEKASRLYAQKVKEKSGRDTGVDISDMNAAFNQNGGILKVTDCSDTTEINIQSGQNYLSQGVVAGCKNPLTHNPDYQRRLVERGLFTEKDCLDMLSIISHLFTRLDNARQSNPTP